jgi:DNA-binding MarR family transcriptional regulator
LTFNNTLLRLVRKGYDFTDRQKCVLFAVKKKPQTVRGMAEDLNISKPAVTRAVDRLEHEGYVGRKEEMGDRRSVLVFITEAGRKMLEFIAGVDEE